MEASTKPVYLSVDRALRYIEIPRKDPPLLWRGRSDKAHGPLAGYRPTLRGKPWLGWPARSRAADGGIEISDPSR